VCSPELTQQIHTVDDLRNIPVIRENEKLYGWKSWFADQGIDAFDLQSRPTYADASLCLDAAMTGQGVFMAWETLGCDAFERGHIASPFDQRSRTDATYWFATSQHAARMPSVKTFRQWLEAELDCSINQWNSGLVL
jgi:DNA-binding transcriptional LysR family regulator